jgi:glucose-6-phosphate isomerase
MNLAPLRKRPTWLGLEAHYHTLKTLHLRQLFADDPQRGERMTAEGAGVWLD